MWGNFDLVQSRLSGYSFYPDAKYKTVRGLPMPEQRLEQKVRQYWADKSIPNAEKLKGFDLDLSKFDPRNTSNKEMAAITSVLYDLGVLEDSTCGWLHGVNVEFNSVGNEINMGKKVDLVSHYDRCLKFYSGEISSGRTLVKDVQTSLYTAMSVLQALVEYSQKPRVDSLVDAQA